MTRDIHCEPCHALISETTAHKCGRAFCPARARARQIDADRVFAGLRTAETADDVRAVLNESRTA